MQKLNYTITENEFIDFQVYHFRNSKTYNFRILVNRLMIGIIYSGVIIFCFIEFTSATKYFIMIVSAIIAIVQIISYKSTLEKRIIKSTKRLLSESNNNDTIFGPQSIEFTDLGLIIKGTNYINNYNFSSIVRIAQSIDNVFVYINALQAIIIPQKAFIDDSSVKQFINNLLIKISNK